MWGIIFRCKIVNIEFLKMMLIRNFTFISSAFCVAFPQHPISPPCAPPPLQRLWEIDINTFYSHSGLWTTEYQTIIALTMKNIYLAQNTLLLLFLFVEYLKVGTCINLDTVL